MTPRTLTIGTLCSGIGAPEFALQHLGIHFKILFACDIDPVVKETYLNNHLCETFYDDVFGIKNAPHVDLLIFGFPCQAFSVAGKRLGLQDERGKVILGIMDVIEQSKPDTFIAENVEGLESIDDGKTLKLILRRFKKLGYNVAYNVLNARDFGVPQNRRRLFIVGTRGSKEFVFPTPAVPMVPLNCFLDSVAPQGMYATRELLLKPKAATRIANYKHDYFPCLTMAVARNGSSSEYISCIAAVYRAIGQKRKPTIDECRKLMGFPNSFKFPPSVSTTKRYEMLANSMVVPVLGAIIKEIVD